MYWLLRPILFMLEPEEAHEYTLKLLEKAHQTHLLGVIAPYIDLPVRCMGIQLPNPVGLAAGLDKNGAYIDALAELGFGFIEVGTVTPRPQAGNDKPRLFRLKEYGAIINRMGFNNDGVDALISNICKANYQGVLGINIGKNATTPVENALDDYVYCLERVYTHASYITVNISSPNTTNLRQLQDKQPLTQLISALKECHTKLANQHGYYVPIALKVAPDLDDTAIDDIAQVLIDFEIDGLIATNTTVGRSGVEMHKYANEQGGLSGRPLAYHSGEILAAFSDRLADKVDIIGVGGIDSGDMAVKKLKLGATAVQLYTGLVYQGFGLVGDCVRCMGEYYDTPKLGLSINAPNAQNTNNANKHTNTGTPTHLHSPNNNGLL